MFQVQIHPFLGSSCSFSRLCFTSWVLGKISVERFESLLSRGVDAALDNDAWAVFGGVVFDEGNAWMGKNQDIYEQYVVYKSCYM